MVGRLAEVKRPLGNANNPPVRQMKREEDEEEGSGGGRGKEREGKRVKTEKKLDERN